MKAICQNKRQALAGWYDDEARSVADKSCSKGKLFAVDPFVGLAAQLSKKIQYYSVKSKNPLAFICTVLLAPDSWGLKVDHVRKNSINW